MWNTKQLVRGRKINREFAFISFLASESAHEAIRWMHGTYIPGLVKTPDGLTVRLESDGPKGLKSRGLAGAPGRGGGGPSGPPGMGGDDGAGGAGGARSGSPRPGGDGGHGVSHLQQALAALGALHGRNGSPPRSSTGNEAGGAAGGSGEGPKPRFIVYYDALPGGPKCSNCWRGGNGTAGQCCENCTCHWDGPEKCMCAE